MTRHNLLKMCYTAMGIALYVALSLCIQVPVFENYYICLGYVVFLVYCYIFGPISGMIVGGAGCLLHCFLINGLRGMPGWITANVFMAFIMGMWFDMIKIKKAKDNWKSKVVKVMTVAMIVSTTGIGVLFLKSLVEVALYAQPLTLRMANNIYAFVADAVVLVISLPICEQLNKYIKFRSIDKLQEGI